MIGIIKAVVNAEGIISIPACCAVHPSVACVYKGIIKVEPYKPKPMIKDNMVPTLRLPFCSTLNSTIGFLKLNSRQMKKNNPKTAVTVNSIMVPLLNQSSSCPFSNTYYNEPTAVASNAIPHQSTSLALLFSAYLGLRTN